MRPRGSSNTSNRHSVNSWPHRCDTQRRFLNLVSFTFSLSVFFGFFFYFLFLLCGALVLSARARRKASCATSTRVSSQTARRLHSTADTRSRSPSSSRYADPSDRRFRFCFVCLFFTFRSFSLFFLLYFRCLLTTRRTCRLSST
jgi:hypothetical protein